MNMKSDSQRRREAGAAAPLVSVVMPVYNGERYLAEAIESILEQTFTDFEFIIVDDGSTDGSAEIVRGYQARDERVRLVQLQRNMGMCDARNAGMAAASGEYIASMDGDDYCPPERLQTHVNFLQDHPEIGLCAVRQLVVDEDLSPYFWREEPEHHALNVLNMFFRRSSVVGHSYLVRSQVMRSIGGYDPGRRRCDDYELFLRLFQATRVACIPSHLYWRRSHPQNHSGQAHNRASHDKEISETRALTLRWLEQNWGAAPAGFLGRVERLMLREKFSWRERRLLRQELRRLVDAWIAVDALTEADRPLVEADIKQWLEWTTPRLWQMWLHWWRYRVARHLK